MDRLPVKLANAVSNQLNQMLLGKEARERAELAKDTEGVQYWYAYQLAAERELQAMGIHLAAPLE